MSYGASVEAWRQVGIYAPNRHDTGSTTARSLDEVALIRDTISHYAPLLIAPLSVPNSSRQRPEKIRGAPAGETF
jgi:hypothetical protein